MLVVSGWVGGPLAACGGRPAWPGLGVRATAATVAVRGRVAVRKSVTVRDGDGGRATVGTREGGTVPGRVDAGGTITDVDVMTAVGRPRGPAGALDGAVRCRSIRTARWVADSVVVRR